MLDETDVAERVCDAQSVAQFAADGQRFLMRFEGGGVVAFILRDDAQIAQQIGFTRAVACVAADGKRAFVALACGRQVAPLRGDGA